MRAERPKLDDAKVKVFLESVPGQVMQKPRKPVKDKVAKGMKKGGASSATAGRFERTVTKGSEQMVKFMLELPIELRRKIKFASVSAEEPMNSLIVNTLMGHFR